MKRLSRRRSRTPKSTSNTAEACEVRQLLSAVSVEAAAIDGIGNNEDNPEWGSTGEELLRLTTVEYADGISDPAGEDRVSAREVSNAIAAQSSSILNERGLTDYVWIWGQFIDHDIDLSDGADPAEEFNIAVPAGDVFFDPFGTGEVEIGLERSAYVEGDDSSDGIRQQLNAITAFLDGSVVYGSDQERADALRTFEGGLLKTSDGDLLPFNEDGLDNAGGTFDSLFLAGDVRANENVALSSMHTIFVREHNRIATELAAQNPDLTDEELYQQARAIVTAELQVITYNEYLPALLGTDALSAYAGYDATVNPGIANEFSTAAYRFGHSLLSPELQRLDADGNVIEAGNLSLQNAFFSPDELVDEGIDAILRGAATQLAQELDSQIIDDVRNFLFGPPGAGGLDLASLNIQRGRDHGLADYNQVRIDLGLTPVTSFDQITSDPALALALEETYGSVDNIDLWVGGLAEDHLDESSLGETFTAIIVDQFERIRAGDSNWYQNVFSGRQLRELEQTTLADVIERNTDIDGLQDNVFFAEDAQPVVEPDTDQPRPPAQPQQNRQRTSDRRSPRLALRSTPGTASLNDGGMMRGAVNLRERPAVAQPPAGAETPAITVGDANEGNDNGGVTRRLRRIPRAAPVAQPTDAMPVSAIDSVFEDADLLNMESNPDDDARVRRQRGQGPTNRRRR